MPQSRNPDLGLLAYLSTGDEGSSAKQSQKRRVPSPRLGSGPASQRLPQDWQTSLVLSSHQPQPRRQLCREVLRLLLRLALYLWVPVLLLLVLSQLQADLWLQLPLSRCHPQRCHLKRCHCQRDLCLLLLLCSLYPPQCPLLCLFPQVGWALLPCFPFLKVGKGSPACPPYPCSLLVFQYLWGQCHLIPILSMLPCHPGLVIPLCHLAILACPLHQQCP